MNDLTVALGLAGTTLEGLGRALASRVVALNVWTALLLVAAALLERLLARRVRASLRIALYAPVLLRVVLPPAWTLPGAPGGVAEVFAPLVRIAGGSASELPGWPALSWHALAAAVYLVVVVGLAARALLARVRLERALDEAITVPSGPLGVGCRVVKHDHLGPMAVGLLDPRIVVPARLLAPDEERALACVLGHEQAHVRRGDAWLAAAMELLGIVAWPVLPVRFAIARVRQLVELACDEAAVADADAAERRRYGHTLLDIAAWQSRAGVAAVGQGPLHFGSILHARIEALASQRHWPLPAQALSSGLASLSTLVVLVACGSTAAPSPTSPNDQASGYGYEFETDSSKASKSAAATPPPGPDGRIPPEAIQTSVRSHFGALKACYERGLAKNAALAGKVTVKIVIGADGTTMQTADDASTLPDPDVVSCIVRELGTATYPAGSGVVTVVYPIEFAP